MFMARRFCRRSDCRVQPDTVRVALADRLSAGEMERLDHARQINRAIGARGVKTSPLLHT